MLSLPLFIIFTAEKKQAFSKLISFKEFEVTPLKD
jgi:hypothetical protein